MISETERHLEARISSQRSAVGVQLAALIAAGICIALAARLQTPINEERKELQLVLNSDIYRELPPKYAWVSAAGGTFRGIAADILWARAEDLKQEGKYYESHQLAKWICTLQPRFAAVWSFQAWNMAYNISVATFTERERWQWVYNGIRLLRDEGIPNNDKVIPLYHQLAWTFNHKVGARADDFHWTYKRIWAGTMENLLGRPPVGKSNAETIDWFRPVAEAPHTLEALLAKHAGVKPLIAQLDELGVDVEATTSSQNIFHPLEDAFFKPYTRFQLETQMRALRSEGEQDQSADETPITLDSFFETAPETELNALLAYLRSKVLREQYKMDPQYMLDLTGQLETDEPIPIDWRTPWSHAIYWAKYGVDLGRQNTKAKEFDLINTDRILLNAVAVTMLQGNYVFRINPDDYDASFLATGPDIRYIEAMHKMYLKLGKVHAQEDEDVGNTAGEMLFSGHVNHLQTAIVNLYWAGKKEEARKYLDYLAVNYKNPFTHETKPRYLQGLDDFVRSQMQEVAGTYQEALYTINSMLQAGYLNLASGQLNEFTTAVQNAKLIYDSFQKDFADDRRGRMTLPKFADMRAQVLANFAVNSAYPLYWRSIIWNREQADITRRFYDLIITDLTNQCNQLKVDVARAFPEPPGMEAWRKEHPAPASPEEIYDEFKKAREKREQTE